MHKSFITLFAAVITAVCLSQCASNASKNTGMKLLEEQRVRRDGEDYLVRRYLVSENPRETLSETIKISKNK